MFNCLHYNLDQECFFEAFGSEGIELGEQVDPKVQKVFDLCWNRTNREAVEAKRKAEEKLRLENN